MNAYAVTREYSDHGWNEPPEYGCDVVAVSGRTKREMKAAAVRAFRQTRARGIEWSENPFGQFRLEPADCAHGLGEAHPQDDHRDFVIDRACPICAWVDAREWRMEWDELESWEMDRVPLFRRVRVPTEPPEAPRDVV